TLGSMLALTIFLGLYPQALLKVSGVTMNQLAHWLTAVSPLAFQSWITMTLTNTDLLSRLPFFLVGLTALCTLAGITFKRNHTFSAWFTYLGLIIALLCLIPVWSVTPVQVTPLLLLDGYSILYMAMALISTLVCATLAHAYLEGFPDRCEEFYT